MQSRAILPLLLVATLSPRVHAQTPAPLRVALDWRVDAGAEACGDQAGLERAVGERLERNAFVQRDAADVLIEGGVTSAARGYHVTILTRAPDRRLLGVRELDSESEDCSVLEDDVALVIALIIEAPATRSHLRIPPRPEEWRGEVEASVAAAYGLLPGIAFGPRLSAGVTPPGVPTIAVHVTAYVPAETEVDGKGVRLVAWQAGASLCPRIIDGTSLELSACGGIDAGVVQAAGFGLDLAREPTRLVVLPGARAAIAVPLSEHLLLGSSLGLAVPIPRYRFTFTAADGSEQEIYRPNPVVATATLGLAFAVP